MAATKIDGTAIAKKIRERLRTEIADVKETNPRFRPSLKIIQGDYPPVFRADKTPWLTANHHCSGRPFGFL
jgi:5,10-methylene-tetrahydrofolate dehydrogenase/methenyl tetrahydrofolate cyclohydrolase